MEPLPLIRHGPPGAPPVLFLHGFTIACRLPNDPGELARSLAGMGTGRQASLWPHLSGLEGPALILAGALDEKYRRLTREMAARSGGRLRRVVVEGAGHNIQAERPARFARQLEAFLNTA